MLSREGNANGGRSAKTKRPFFNAQLATKYRPTKCTGRHCSRQRSAIQCIAIVGIGDTIFCYWKTNHYNIFSTIYCNILSSLLLSSLLLSSLLMSSLLMSSLSLLLSSVLSLLLLSLLVDCCCRCKFLLLLSRPLSPRQRPRSTS
jgi:hypothetical protein